MRIIVSFLILFLLSSAPAGAQTAPGGENGACMGGKPGAPIRIEVFSDYQCPACRQFYMETMRPVLDNYASADKVCVVYREFPLTMHAHAREAAHYAHAAQLLGMRYWRLVTDALYQSQPQWSANGQLEPVVAGVLSEEDMGRLRKWMEDPAVEAAISRDIALARERNVTATPTFFVTAQGKTEKVAGVVQYFVLQRYLDHLLGQ